jgi:hypothetical protein
MNAETVAITLAVITTLIAVIGALVQFSVFDKLKAIDTTLLSSSEIRSQQAIEIAVLKRDVSELRSGLKGAYDPEKVVSKEDWHRLLHSMTESAHKVERSYMELSFAVADLVQDSAKAEDVAAGLHKKLEEVGQDINSLKTEITELKGRIEA